MFKSKLPTILRKYKSLKNIVTIEEPYASSIVFLIKFNNFRYMGANCILIHDEFKCIETILYDSDLNKCIDIDTNKNYVKTVSSLINKIVYYKNKSMLINFYNILKNNNIMNTLVNIIDIIDFDHFLIKFKKINQLFIKIQLNYVKQQDYLKNTNEQSIDKTDSNFIEFLLFDKNNKNIIIKPIISVEEIVLEIFNCCNKYIDNSALKFNNFVYPT